MRTEYPGANRADIVIFYIIYCCFLLLGQFSRKSGFWIAEWVGRFWFAVDRRHRNVAIGNLMMVYGDSMPVTEIRRLARRVFCSLSKMVFEIGWNLRMCDVRLRREIRFQGLQHIYEAEKRGKGVLVLTAHFGNWELLLRAIGLVGFPVSAVYRPFDFKPLDMFFRHLRRRGGSKLYPKKRAMRKIIKGLGNNEFIGILLDQSSKVTTGVSVDFLGTPAGTSKGLALLAKSTGAPVIPAFLIRHEEYYTVRFEPALHFVDTGDKDSDIIENTRIYNRIIESVILEYPEQWFWVHRRWKNRPARRQGRKPARSAGLG